jgi:hypothetical protein
LIQQTFSAHLLHPSSLDHVVVRVDGERYDLEGHFRPLFLSESLADAMSAIGTKQTCSMR